jgi:hypothetical protein
MTRARAGASWKRRISPTCSNFPNRRDARRRLVVHRLVEQVEHSLEAPEQKVVLPR